MKNFIKDTHELNENEITRYLDTSRNIPIGAKPLSSMNWAVK